MNLQSSPASIVKVESDDNSINTNSRDDREQLRRLCNAQFKELSEDFSQSIPVTRTLILQQKHEFEQFFSSAKFKEMELMNKFEDIERLAYWNEILQRENDALFKENRQLKIELSTIKTKQQTLLNEITNSRESLLKMIDNMSSPGNYAKGYVRWTAGGKRVMWDGARWQQLCQIEKCFKRDQKSQGVCLIHYREQQEKKVKPKNKKFKPDEKEEKIKVIKEKKSSHNKRTSISTRSKRVKSSNSVNDSTKVSDTDLQNSDVDISDSEISKRKSSTSNLSPAKPYKSSRTFVLVCSSLTRQQMSQVELFCTRFSGRVSNQIDEKTTHLIASEVDSRVCCLTKKVFFAVAYHQYVIGYQWIEDCLQKHSVINEESYEIQGDASLSSQHNGMHRSRLIHEPIFKSYPYAIAVECSIGCQQGMFTRQELEQLVELSGAILLQEHNRQQLDMNTTIVVLCDDEDKMVVKKYNGLKNKITYVIPEFFLDSVVLYEVQPIKGYELLYQID